MKDTILQTIRCPKCRSRFEIRNPEIRNREIWKGVLACQSCHSEYPVINYIPRLVDNYNYSSSWGELWKETGHLLRDSFTGQPWHYNVIHGKYNEDNLSLPGTSPFGFEWPVKMRGEKILEIGPGTGNCTEHLVKTQAELFCVDMSDAIDTFPEDLLTRSNIHVIQADITTGILPDNYFDRIWFFQVLQHTPTPPDTLKVIRNFLKSGGELAVTSYKGHFNPWYYFITKRIDAKLSWKLISRWIPKLVPLKYKLQKFFYRIHAPFLARVLRGLTSPIDPRNVYFEVLERKMDDWLQGIMWNKSHDPDLLMKYVIVNTFDTITPTYTNNCKDNPTMEKWLKDAGYSSFRVWGTNGVRAKAWK